MKSMLIASLAGLALGSRRSHPATTPNKLRGGAQVGGGTCSGTTYDFFEFVTQWDITECMDVYNCQSSVQYTTIHGLWPSNLNSEDYPCNCAIIPFDANNITRISSQMNQYWPSLNGANSDFWSHEWSKHGTCAMDVLPTQLKYFSAALNIRSKYDIISAMTNAGYPPSNNNGFTLSQMKQALQAAYGSSMDITASCDSNGNIQEMTQCFDKNLNAITCPTYLTNNCQASTLYLPSSMSR